MVQTTIEARQIGSDAAADGEVLTADGAGVAAWEALDGGEINHNDLSNIDGGAAAEYYHMTKVEHDAAIAGSGIAGYGSRTPGQIPKFEGISTITDSVLAENAGKVSFPDGTGINEFSTDGTLASDSDDVVSTEKAVKLYSDDIICRSWLGV